MFSCSKPYSNELEAVLEQAGKNRKELEKVLKHYSQNPADSLKWRAVEFLIVNMPGKYSEYYDALWNDVATGSSGSVTVSWNGSSYSISGGGHGQSGGAYINSSSLN
jgi:hypothetical protein